MAAIDKSILNRVRCNRESSNPKMKCRKGSGGWGDFISELKEIDFIFNFCITCVELCAEVTKFHD